MNDQLLKRTFLLDAAGALVSAAVLLPAADALAEPLGLSSGFLTVLGWLMLPFAALFLTIARTGSRALATIGIVGNIAWVIASAAVIPWLQPTTLGTAVIVVQAVIVAELAWFEWKGLRRMQATA